MRALVGAFQHHANGLLVLSTGQQQLVEARVLVTVSVCIQRSCFHHNQDRTASYSTAEAMRVAFRLQLAMIDRAYLLLGVGCTLP